MRTGGRSHRASSRSSVSIRCAPRLLPATACSSSTITLLTDLSMSRPASEVSRMYSDSGVVTRMCGGVRRMRSRSAVGVSPVRTASRMPGSGSPIASRPARMPASGSCRFLRMSLDSAFSGEMYRTWTWSARLPCAKRSTTRSLMADRKAARVLPEPVGAAISACRCCAVTGQARLWTSVGWPKRECSQPDTAGWNSDAGAAEWVDDVTGKWIGIGALWRLGAAPAPL